MLTVSLLSTGTRKADWLFCSNRDRRRYGCRLKNGCNDTIYTINWASPHIVISITPVSKWWHISKWRHVKGTYWCSVYLPVFGVCRTKGIRRHFRHCCSLYKFLIEPFLRMWIIKKVCMKNLEAKFDYLDGSRWFANHHIYIRIANVGSTSGLRRLWHTTIKSGVRIQVLTLRSLSPKFK